MTTTSTTSTTPAPIYGSTYKNSTTYVYPNAYYRINNIVLAQGDFYATNDFPHVVKIGTGKTWRETPTISACENVTPSDVEDYSQVGTITHDEHSFYVKHSTGWRKVGISTLEEISTRDYIDEEIQENFNLWSVMIYRNVLDSSSSIAQASYGSVIGVADATLDNGWLASTFSNSSSEGGPLADADCPTSLEDNPTFSTFRFGALNSTLAAATSTTNGFIGISKGMYHISVDLGFKFDTGPTYPLMRNVKLDCYSGSKLLGSFESTLSVTGTTNDYKAQINGMVNFTSDSLANNGFIIHADDTFGSTNDWIPISGRVSIARV